MIKLSVAIITFNEEKNIKRCIESVQEVADDILVVDSFSKDQTKAICLGLGARVIENTFKGHIEQKNFALKESKHDYVLSLDADEALDEDLISQIKEVKKNWQADGYEFNRKTRYVDQWITHCGWYPDTKLRLVKKSVAKWGGVNPHDLLELKENSSIKKLEGDLLHYSYNSISEHVAQTNKFTTIAAKEAFNRGKRVTFIGIIVRPIFKFLRDYFLKLGFLEGRYGLIICLINSLSSFLKYSKISELMKNREI